MAELCFKVGNILFSILIIVFLLLLSSFYFIFNNQQQCIVLEQQPIYHNSYLQYHQTNSYGRILNVKFRGHLQLFSRKTNKPIGFEPIFVTELTLKKYNSFSFSFSLNSNCALLDFKKRSINSTNNVTSIYVYYSTQDCTSLRTCIVPVYRMDSRQNVSLFEGYTCSQTRTYDCIDISETKCESDIFVRLQIEDILYYFPEKTLDLINCDDNFVKVKQLPELELYENSILKDIFNIETGINYDKEQEAQDGEQINEQVDLFDV